MNKEKNPAAVALGSLGGFAAARSMTKEQRIKRATDAVRAREAKRVDKRLVKKAQ